MKLYQGNLSPFASRVRMQVYAKGLDGKQIEIMAPPGGTGSAEYKALVPTGKIPALDTGKRVLPESEVICEYIEDAFPETPLRPADADSRAQVRLLSRFVDIYLYPRMAPLYAHLNPAVRDQQVVDSLMPAFDEGLEMLERMLKDGGYKGGAYAVGDSLTLADCALITGLFFVAALMPGFGRANTFEHVPTVGRYFQQGSVLPVAGRVLQEMQVALKQLQGG